ncbi:hypothetical protein LDG_5288 [Legionella drancourtii LLAP12]|uniref:Transposase IS204/IS1001/IS1096/IS1165 zinc-finger domain-containing protein n=1 Tax=Legionella drancourtii LLAP12 TaxID=658187 RepID=G9EJC8_9GAMM|nr:hypothetical protein LDG_5288 [Legionella drancourtii LLAP12]
MPKHNLILNLPGFTIQKVSGYQPLILDISYHRLPRCAHCQSKAVRKKSSYIRTVAHELILGRPRNFENYRTRVRVLCC